MKKLFCLFIFSVVLIVLAPSVFAQGTGDVNVDPDDLPEIVEDIDVEGNPYTSEQTGDGSEVTSYPQDCITEDNTISFITGVAVGGAVGIIVGGIFVWAMKDKIV